MPAHVHPRPRTPAPALASTHSSAHAYASALTRGWGRRAAEGRVVDSIAMCGAAAERVAVAVILPSAVAAAMDGILGRSLLPRIA
jgi:hypothetical protein